MHVMIEGDWTTSGTRAAREVETRLRSARRYVRATADMLADHTFHRLEDEIDLDLAELERRWETATEFPLLAWSTTLAFSLSTLETYLDAAVDEAASLAQRPTPAKLPGAKVEGHLRRLAQLGVRVHLTDELTQKLRALRQVRNALTHELAVDAPMLSMRAWPASSTRGTAASASRRPNASCRPSVSCSSALRRLNRPSPGSSTGWRNWQSAPRTSPLGRTTRGDAPSERAPAARPDRDDELSGIEQLVAHD